MITLAPVVRLTSITTIGHGGPRVNYIVFIDVNDLKIYPAQDTSYDTPGMTQSLASARIWAHKVAEALSYEVIEDL